MTVIAWDGKTLAADKRMSFAGSHATVTKIQRINGHLVGTSGDVAQGHEMVEWFTNGCDPDKLPAKQRTDPISMLVLSPAGEIRHYTGSHIPRVIEDRYFAIGSGADYATAVMHLGHDSIKAVKVACDLDPGCGNGVDTLVLRTFTAKPPTPIDVALNGAV